MGEASVTPYARPGGGGPAGFGCTRRCSSHVSTRRGPCVPCCDSSVFGTGAASGLSLPFFSSPPSMFSFLPLLRAPSPPSGSPWGLPFLIPPSSPPPHRLPHSGPAGPLPCSFPLCPSPCIFRAAALSRLSDTALRGPCPPSESLGPLVPFSPSERLFQTLQTPEPLCRCLPREVCAKGNEERGGPGRQRALLGVSDCDGPASAPPMPRPAIVPRSPCPDPPWGLRVTRVLSHAEGG